MAEHEKSKTAPKKHKKPHKIITTRAKDGSFGHEHIHEGNPTPIFAGTSQNMDDLHAHMDDHFGGGAEPAEPEEPAAAPGGGGPEAA